jgi:hypothetical protein
LKHLTQSGIRKESHGENKKRKVVLQLVMDSDCEKISQEPGKKISQETGKKISQETGKKISQETGKKRRKESGWAKHMTTFNGSSAVFEQSHYKGKRIASLKMDRKRM